MATFDQLALMPYADVQAVDVPFGNYVICGNYIAYPYWWNTTGFNLGISGDYSAQEFGATYNRAATMQLLNQYKSCKSMRSFYPSLPFIYQPAQGLGCLSMAWFLKLLDFWHSQTNDAGETLDVLWIPECYRQNGSTAANLEVFTGYNQDTAVGEQALVDAWEAIFGSWASATSNDIGTGAKTFTLPTGLLLTNANHVKLYQTSNPAKYIIASVTSYTSGTGALVVNGLSEVGVGAGITDWSIKLCSPLGFTIAEHPALMGVELANESVQQYTPNNAAARAARITYKMVKKYKPACKVIQVSSSNASRFWVQLMKGNAASLIPLAIDGDDGTGKQFCDYVQDGIAQHPYIGGNTAVARAAAIADNSFCSSVVSSNTALNLTCLDVVTKVDAACTKFGTDPDVVPLWVTETGPIMTMVSPTAGGWTSFMASKEEKLNNLIRWALPQILTTRNGAGGLGKFFFYAFDGSGSNGGVATGETALKNGSSGTIDKLFVQAHTDGRVRITMSNSFAIPFSATVLDQSIVITAGAGGWADLGLSAGERKRFTANQIAGSTVVLQDTVFTAAPANNATYTEFQMDWSPFPEELKQLKDRLTNNGAGGLVSWGWINYPGKPRGFWFSVKGVGTWYTAADGAVRRWDKAA